MKLADVSIKRPVFATMMIGVLVVFGVVLYTRLNVDMYPDVDFPVVTITTIYPGADPETMESQVSDPIEEVVNSLSGIRALRSVSLESVSQVFVQFDLDVPLDTATQDVRDRVASLQDQLPSGAESPTVQKLDLGAAPIMQLAVSGRGSQSQLLRYAEDRLKPALERVDGVGQIQIVGGRDREMHVWVDPSALRSYGITVDQLAGALARENVDVPGGRIVRSGQELTVRTDAEAAGPRELAALPVATVDGAMVRVSDVARVEDGFEERRSSAFVDGEPALAIVIQKQSDANTVEVAEAVTEALPSLREAAPTGTHIDVLVDNSVQIRGSIETVQLDLVLGALLAVLIIFLFLRDWRATFISALALPTAVIGTFGFVQAMGFTLNLMTTLALSLSIGILIDDAIVVIENIVRRRTTMGESPRVAASRGVGEIGLAVIAVTLSIVAVFVPVAFMEGMIGQFFYEFGLTVAVAVLLSLFVSFTLTPMLSARMLKEHQEEKGLSAVIERALRWIEGFYRNTVRWALRHRLITMSGAVAALIATFALLPMLGFEFIPISDQGQFVAKMDMPTGSSLEQTETQARRIASRIREVPGVESTFTTVGGGAQERVDTAQIVVSLVDRDRRTYHQTEAMSHVRELLERMPGVQTSVEQMQMVSGGGMRNAQMQLDLRGGDLAELEATAERIAARMEEAGGYVDLDTSAEGGKPELAVQIDRARAADLGVAPAQVAMTVRNLVAGAVATQIQDGDDRYDVRIQLPEEERTSAGALEQVQLRTATGALIELGDVARVAQSEGPSIINRQARQRQVSVFANLEGKALGDAMAEVESFAADEVEGDTSFAFGGTAEVMEESLGNMLFALMLAVICVYMILAAQFESFVHPFTIMMSLPFSLIGAFGALLIVQMHMTIFGMIGLIMLMGLVTKNAILLVDFANQKRDQGQPLLTAMEEAGAVRLRPILMTTAAMIFGMLPVAIGHGEGGEMRAPMGVVVIGGLITSTALTLVVVPVVYTLVDGLIQRVRRLFGLGSAARDRDDAAHASQAEEGAPAE